MKFRTTRRSLSPPRSPKSQPVTDALHSNYSGIPSGEKYDRYMRGGSRPTSRGEQLFTLQGLPPAGPIITRLMQRLQNPVLSEESLMLETRTMVNPLGSNAPHLDPPSMALRAITKLRAPRSATRQVVTGEAAAMTSSSQEKFHVWEKFRKFASNKRIMVLTDDREVQQMMRRVTLQDKDTSRIKNTLFFAQNSVEVIRELFHRTIYHLLVLDASTSDISPVLRAIRSMPPDPKAEGSTRVPIITLVTPSVDASDEMKTACTCILRKPVQPQVFRDALVDCFAS